MTRNPNIAVVTIGYNSYALEDAQSALELMALLSKAVQVEEGGYSIRAQTPCTYFLAEDDKMPELKFIPVRKFNPNETEKEARARFEREAGDRADMDQQFHEAPPALEAHALASAPADEAIF